MTAPGPEDEVGPPRRSRWWIAAITFVAGVVVGVLAVGLLSARNPTFPVAGEQPASGGSSGPGGGQTVAVTAQAEVNAACLRVINAAQDVYTILSGVDEAARDVDLQQLDDIVRQLEPVEPRLEQGLRDCRVQTMVAGQQPSSAPSRAVTPSPTATGTR